MRHIKTLIILSLLVGLFVVAGCSSKESFGSGTGYAAYQPPTAPSAGGCGVTAPVEAGTAPSVEPSLDA
ncbi:hypothetical protein HZB03_02160 [Candidatus Woesearchaeota archaeon]|nr:hypothetical protein [Candidatus Woesearchaeota archaeon]